MGEGKDVLRNNYTDLSDTTLFASLSIGPSIPFNQIIPPEGLQIDEMSIPKVSQDNYDNNTPTLMMSGGSQDNEIDVYVTTRQFQFWESTSNSPHDIQDDALSSCNAEFASCLELSPAISTPVHNSLKRQSSNMNILAEVNKRKRSGQCDSNESLTPLSFNQELFDSVFSEAELFEQGDSIYKPNIESFTNVEYLNKLSRESSTRIQEFANCLAYRLSKYTDET
ncbi:uncharacterized protein SPAPADRAFT_52233 [Spathaspora passalidarum NRRL Y-27907]|uniref:Uncharacterized protein n=1 Tax=Spathaspora passalidarum (strain NRRL Y-27907 / 11-Y1) TaxID=619300 RepID=G3AS92_SPAPN|nr:uncharacterized protein SPAPADRAFT_52233 [Spathaspora passalidarum NRRL Y-27907]EGW31051.1 hypothetical protein SPAPADRAFT_52233 [Spathaspora passalidarum NRRL Y-27907]